MRAASSVLRQKFIDEFTTPQSRFAGQLVLQAWTRFARILLARLSSSNVAYKQLCCLPNGNGPAIMVALRAHLAGSTVVEQRCLQTALLFA